jgi:hypothetical protein
VAQPGEELIVSVPRGAEQVQLLASLEDLFSCVDGWDIMLLRVDINQQGSEMTQFSLWSPSSFVPMR